MTENIRESLEVSTLIQTAVHLAEKLRRHAIGEPAWIPGKRVYEYSEHSVKVVGVLKLMRMAEGVAALNLLRANGLFVDMGAIIRCVQDCEAEIYFLFEKYPATSPDVEKFVKAFFEHTIDGYLDVETEPVPSRKIRAALVRVLRGQHDHKLLESLQKVHETFCGYIHADVMKVQKEGTFPTDTFPIANGETLYGTIIYQKG
jgi:hypothetical protein